VCVCVCGRPGPSRLTRLQTPLGTPTMVSAMHRRNCEHHRETKTYSGKKRHASRPEKTRAKPCLMSPGKPCECRTITMKYEPWGSTRDDRPYSPSASTLELSCRHVQMNDSNH